MVRDYDALHAFIAERRRTRFAWGKHAHDCVAFAAGAVRAQTARDLLAELRADWTSERGAVRVLKRLGGLEAVVDARLAGVAPAMAARGDVAGWRDGKGRLQLAIVEGETLIGPGLEGLERLPRAAMVRAWRATDFL